MTQSVDLLLRNPSEYPRAGLVVRQWKPVAKALGVRGARSATVARLLDPTNPKGATVDLAAQVDRLVPHDRSHDQLVFKLDSPIPGGDEHYRAVSGKVRVTAAQSNAQPYGATVQRYPTGVKLINQHLEVWLNTSATKYAHQPQDQFYGGAVTSVILQKASFPPFTDRLECVDAIESRAGFWPHPEARAMQIDRIHLVRPPWDERRSVDFFPFREPWTLVSDSTGPVRAVATIMSAPFELRCKEAGGKSDHVFECNVYRTLSLYDDVDWIGDEIWVNARDIDTGKTQRLWFTARFFMMVQFTQDPELFKYPDHPGWFSLTPPDKPSSDPRLGYAFATDAQSGAIWSPPLDYHDEMTKPRAFSWELGTSRTVHCVHKFRCMTNALEMGHEAGWLWYDLVFKRIRGTLAGEK
ncbi:MAG TPA: hypothetical protein VEO54_18040 [Thermoanaerobaculia bacterium]|nr:hypothetical protein [Thermoanaerobaculia bacterium]